MRCRSLRAGVGSSLTLFTFRDVFSGNPDGFPVPPDDDGVACLFVFAPRIPSGFSESFLENL